MERSRASIEPSVPVGARKSEGNAGWIAIQKNAREHYAIPRVLQSLGLLNCLITDLWIEPGTFKGRLLGGAGSSRWHPDLLGSAVVSCSWRFLAWRALARKWRAPWWKKIEIEDRYFQRWVANRVASMFVKQSPGVCFSFSYTAREPFRRAKEAGWLTVLGQVDPGPIEWKIVSKGARDYAHLEEALETPSERYWEQWREEIALADRVIANSDWSAELLLQQGVPSQKIRVIPLLYEAHADRVAVKSFPDSFNKSRPLRVLFLGRVCLRKGVGQLLDAMRRLGDEPIHLRCVGPSAMQIPDWVRNMSSVSLEPPATPSEVSAAYAWADVFILPTLSDGFAMTQLEALERRVPVIASEYCGRVVQHMENGWLLDEVTPEAIESALRHILSNPSKLADWSQNTKVPSACSMSALAQKYEELSRELCVDAFNARAIE